jgi:hypothetical protein
MAPPRQLRPCGETVRPEFHGSFALEVDAGRSKPRPYKILTKCQRQNKIAMTSLGGEFVDCRGVVAMSRLEFRRREIGMVRRVRIVLRLQA